MATTFEKWLQELAAEEKLEDWWISRGSVPAPQDTLANWRDFIQGAFRVRGERVRGRSLHTSYLWHDEMASQLRFATAPVGKDSLPFGCRVRIVDDPDSIIESWLEDPGFIAWESLREVALDELSEEDSGEADRADEYVLNVWPFEHLDSE